MKKTKAEVKSIVIRRMVQLNREDNLYNVETWKQIFVDVFGKNPTSTKDERWDILLRERDGEGYGALNIVRDYFA